MHGHGVLYCKDAHMGFVGSIGTYAVNQSRRHVTDSPLPYGPALASIHCPDEILESFNRSRSRSNNDPVAITYSHFLHIITAFV